MLLRFEAALNGKKFSEIAPELILRDIVEAPAEVETNLNRRGLHAGQIASGRTRLSLSVRLVYVIRSYDIARRAEIRDLVAGWASKGGYLTVNTRPHKRLRVNADIPPALESSLKWTEDLILTLTAYEQPYWEDIRLMSEITTTREETSGLYDGSCTLIPLGNVPFVPLECSFTNESPTYLLTYIKIVSNDTFIELERFTINDERLEIRYTDANILEIIKRTNEGEETSLLKYRTAESSDDVLLKCGENNIIRVYSNVPVSGEIYGRGRWL